MQSSVLTFLFLCTPFTVSFDYRSYLSLSEALALYSNRTAPKLPGLIND